MESGREGEREGWVGRVKALLLRDTINNLLYQEFAQCVLFCKVYPQ